jgi:hypothetical protein
LVIKQSRFRAKSLSNFRALSFICAMRKRAGRGWPRPRLYLLVAPILTSESFFQPVGRFCLSRIVTENF